jgi:hypothetical protein
LKRRLAWIGLCCCLLASSARGQEGTLDVLDGETLYQGGWLLTLGEELRREERLMDGDSTVSDPLHSRRTELTTNLAAHYGLLNTLQLSAVLPYIYKSEERSDPAGEDHLEADGPGDIAAFVKWRYFRWDAPGEAANLAAIGGLELPTGSDDERDGGARLDPELQPGSGSWDPMLGAAITYEPRRWRFNVFGLYKLNTESPDDHAFGDEVFAEIAMGNRFWLQPYPGPFMRLDLLLRYRNEQKARQDGHGLSNTGGDLFTLGVNYAFRVRPSIDLQAAVEVPMYEKVNGVQLAEEVAVTLTFGVRF